MIRKTNTDRQTDRCMDIHKGKVKVAVILSKMIFSSSKLLHAHVQYVFNESVKYQNFSTNSSSQVDFIMHALYHHGHHQCADTGATSTSVGPFQVCIADLTPDLQVCPSLD